MPKLCVRIMCVFVSTSSTTERIDTCHITHRTETQIVTKEITIPETQVFLRIR